MQKKAVYLYLKHAFSYIMHVLLDVMYLNASKDYSLSASL
jgi:hypothetical protein